MLLRLERALRVAFVVVGAGLLTAIIGFALTSQTPGYSYLGGPCMQGVAVAGFDPWTGRRHGRIVETSDCLADPPSTVVHQFEEAIPDDLPDHPVITYPVGFIAGCLGAIVVLGLARVRRHSDPGTTVGPAAPVA